MPYKALPPPRHKRVMTEEMNSIHNRMKIEVSSLQDSQLGPPPG